MALQNLLIETAAKLGYDLNNANQRSRLISKINDAAKELHRSHDIRGCLREQIFEIDNDQQQITLPYYVHEIRGIRHFKSKLPLELVDMRPRYFEGNYFQSTVGWRIKHFTPLAREISNASLLKFQLPLAEGKIFKVIVVGAKTNSDRITEELQFDATDTQRVTTQQFVPTPPGIESIKKDQLTTYNIDVFDQNGAKLATIANSELESRYRIIQVTDLDNNPLSSGDCACYEILYKTRFTPFRNNYDEFPARDMDEAIYWMVLHHDYAAQEGKMNESALALQKAGQIIEQKEVDVSEGLDRRIEFERDGKLNFVRSKFGFGDLPIPPRSRYR